MSTSASSATITWTTRGCLEMRFEAILAADCSAPSCHREQIRKRGADAQTGDRKPHASGARAIAVPPAAARAVQAAAPTGRRDNDRGSATLAPQNRHVRSRRKIDAESDSTPAFHSLQQPLRTRCMTRTIASRRVVVRGRKALCRCCFRTAGIAVKRLLDDVLEESLLR